MKAYLSGLAAVSLGLAVGCGDATDPDTVSPSDLNPPGKLVSVTGDSMVRLVWTAGNTDDDFVGYYVFGVQKSLANVATAANLTYPAGANERIQTVGVPRCSGNNGFFEAFGFKTIEADCEGAAGDSSAIQAGSQLLEADEEERLVNALSCTTEDLPAGTPSVSATPPTTSLQVCDVRKVYNPTSNEFEAIQNGKEYLFFVVAVMDGLTDISWTSNVVADYPSKNALVSGGAATASLQLSIPQAHYVPLTFDETTMQFTAGQATACTNNRSACELDGENTGTEVGLYLGRDSGTFFPQRTFVSGSSAFSFEIGGVDTGVGTFSPRIPGDMASETYVGNVKFPVRDNKVYDFLYTATSGAKHYGKIVIGNVALAGNDVNGTATVDVYVILQTAAGIRHYAQ